MKIVQFLLDYIDPSVSEQAKQYIIGISCTKAQLLFKYHKYTSKIVEIICYICIVISEQQINIIINTLKPYKPSKIGIFGSYSRGENTEESDIDILYSFENAIGLFKLLRLKDDLERSLNKKIDLVSEKYANPKLKPAILNDLKIIYGK